MTSGGYSEHYRHILLHHDQVDRHDEEVAAGRPSAVLERNKKLSAETNKRRKQLEERWRQHEEAEERRRAEVLLARKARLRAATEKYQKSSLPQSARPPASARQQQQRSRSSSLPFQLDGSSPRRASSALDAATAIERALQAIRAEIQPTLRRAQPPPPPPTVPPAACSESALQQRLFSTAYNGANLGSSSARHGGSWGSVAGVGADGRLGSHSGNSSAAVTSHYAAGASAAARDPAASGPDRKMVTTNWDGAAAGQHHSGGAGGGGSGSNSVASAAGQQRSWVGSAGASGSHLLSGSVSQQQHQQQDSRSPVKVASLSTAAVGRQASASGGFRNGDGGGGDDERFAARVGSGSGSKTLSSADSVDLTRASVDSLDEEMPDQMTPRPATDSSSIAASSVSGQRSRNLGGGPSGDGMTAASAAAAATGASGPSRGFSTWRAAEEVASERSQNPHLRDSPDAAAVADEPRRRSADAVNGAGGSRFSAAHTVSAGTSGTSTGDYRPLAQQQQQPHPQQQQRRRDPPVSGEVAGLPDVPDELVQWQAVPSPPWGRHPSAMPRRLSARTTATPLAAPSSLQSANSVGLSTAVGGGGSSSSSSSWVLADQQRTHDGRANVGDRSTAAAAAQQQQQLQPGGVHAGFAAGSGSPSARTTAAAAAAASTPSRTANEPSAGVAGAASAGGTSAAVRLSSGRVLTVHSLARSSSVTAAAAVQPQPPRASPGQSEFSPSTAWTPCTAGGAVAAAAPAAPAMAVAEDYDGLWRSRPPLALRPPGPGRPPQATAYGVAQHLDRTATVGTGESVQPASYAEAMAAAAAAAFDSGSVYSDSSPSLSGRGSSAGAVKGILKRSAAGGSGRGGGSSDNGSGSVHSNVGDRGDLAGSKLRSLSSPNIRDSLDVTRKRNDSCPKPQTPRKKSVRFADSDSEAEEAESESSAGGNASSGGKSAAAAACWISPAHVLDIQELQSLVAPMPQAPASAVVVAQRPISASAAAQKPPAPPPSSARAQRAASASMAAAARRRGIPVAVRPPAVHRRWSADGGSGDGQDSSAAPANVAATDASGSVKSTATTVDDATGVPLGRTPTDEEINNLWHTVRSCLRAGQDASGAADVPAVDGAAKSAPAASPGSQARSPGQAAPVTKITADSLSRLGRTVNGYGHHSGAASPGAAPPPLQLLQLRGRAASDPALAVIQPQPLEQQQQHNRQQEQRLQQQQPQLQAGIGDVARMTERAYGQSTYSRGPASAEQYNGIHAGKDATANSGGWNDSSGYGSVGPSRQNGSVSSSMAAFLAAEELSARPLVSESQISHAVREVEHFHLPAGMHPVPSRVAHFRRGSAGKAVAGAPMSALSLEEQKLLRSLEVLNERLKITEAANSAAMGSAPSAAAVVPARR